VDKILDFDGKPVFYRVVGLGKPVMLVHGFGEDGTIWDYQVDFLKPDYQLIIPDLPGSGKSPGMDDSSMEQMAEMLLRILDEEQIDQCVLLGHSMGGYITLAFAEKFSARLNAFGLIHSTAYADNDEKKAARRKGIEFIGSNGAFEFLKTSSPNLFSALTKDERPELVDQFISSLSNFSGASLVSYYHAMIARPDRTAVLEKAGIPVLFIMGKYDTAIPLEDMRQQSHLPEKSYIHELQYSGHMGMLEETNEVNRFLKEFLLAT
jgi:pimeloyl-ACP methyl ester carboxylesterase